MTTPLKSLLDMGRAHVHARTSRHAKPETNSEFETPGGQPDTPVHSSQKTFPKQRVLAEAATTIRGMREDWRRWGRGWKPTPRGTRNGEKLIPGSLVRWLVTSHRVAEAQLSWGR